MSTMYIIFSIIGINFIMSFLITLSVYLTSLKYYRPLIKKDKNGNKINIHDIYDPFHPHDRIDFFSMWSTSFFCWFIKFISSFIILVIVNLHIRFLYKIHKNTDTNPEQRKQMKDAIVFWSKLFLFFNGVRIENKYPEFKDVYKKYLGDDYDFTDDKYSLVVSNHIGFFEVVLGMSLYAPGFIAKKDIKDYYFIGPISRAIHCLFVDRENQNEKKKIFDSLLERQQSFYNQKLFVPLLLFPEGTCSCGRNILRFKKGAFYSLLPIKPIICTVDQKSDFHLSVGASNVVLSYFKNYCHTINTIYVATLPTIRPTEYMFEKYKKYGSEKWEIFAYVVRKIYAEVGGLEEVDMGLTDIKRYIRAMVTGDYDPNEKTNYIPSNKIKKEHKFNRENNEEIIKIKSADNESEEEKNEKNNDFINKERENIIKENEDFIIEIKS